MAPPRLVKAPVFRRLAIVLVAFALAGVGVALAVRAITAREASSGAPPSEVPAPSPTPRTLPESSGPVSAVLALPGTASSIVAAPNGILYISVVPGADPREILRWDSSGGGVVESAAIPGAERGVEIAFAGGSLWAAWGEDLYRMDPSSLRIVQQVALPSVPGALAASPDGGLWIGVRGDLLILDPSSGETMRTIPVQGTPELLSFDPTGSHAYVETDARAGRDGKLLVELDAVSGEQIASAAVGFQELGGASSIAATSMGVWLSEPSGMMGAASFLPEGTLRGGHLLGPGEWAPGTNAVAVSVADGTLWVSDQGGGTLSCVDPATGNILDRFMMTRSNADLYGRLVTQSGSALFMDGSRYVLRLDAPAACGLR